MLYSGKILQNSIFKSYKRIFFSTLAIILLILFTNQFYIIIASSLNFEITELVELIFWKIIRDAYLIILFITIISIAILLNNLRKKSELVILHSLGLGNIFILKSLMPFLIFIVLFQLIATGYISPIAKLKTELIIDDISSRPDFINFKDRTFQNFNNKNLTIYLEKNNDLGDNLDNLTNIMIFSNTDDYLHVANSGRKLFDPESGKVFLVLNNGKIYTDLLKKNPAVTEYKSSKFLIYKPDKKTEYKLDIGMMNFNELFHYGGNDSLIEFQFRLGFVISLVLLIFLSLELTKPNNREKNYSILLTFILFLIYIGLIISSKNFLQTQSIQLYEAFIFQHALFIILAIILFFKKYKFNYVNKTI